MSQRDTSLTTATTEATMADVHRLQQRFIEWCRQLETAQSEWVSFSE